MDNLPENEFRIMIVKMIQDLRNRMEIMQEMFTKDLEELKNKQTEINNTLEGIDSRITEAEECALISSWKSTKTAISC